MKNKNNPLAYMTREQAQLIFKIVNSWEENHLEIVQFMGEDDLCLLHESKETLERIANADLVDLLKPLPDNSETIAIFTK